ncbi:cytochrome P450 CYP749A22-like [Rhodamnia argentea]|uniref:Cytochrome P450 CYP749A22-like n=1 Tax=Rhodamnia argentea TaxID=178133 RepID=A0A8B8QZ13_9MYRT|nr:cytochrome P450 CYP749A22-like [Rhodamnia argentea]
MGISIAIGLSALFLLLILWSLAELAQKLWWHPLRIQRMMARQGIKGPPYRFIHGSTKETMKMITEARSTPMDNLSHDILPKVQPHIHAWINTYGRNYLSWYGTQAQLIISEPELIKEVLINRDKTYPKTGSKDFGKKLLGDGLVTTKDEVKWAKQRRLANHTFHGESLKNMVPAMVESVHMMLEKWKQQDGKEIDVYEEFKLSTSEVISRTAFGSSYVEGRNIFEMTANLGLLLSRNSLRMRFPGMSKVWKTADEVQAEKLEKGIRGAILEIAKKREKKVMAGEADDYGDDFLGQLVKAYHDTDESKKITVNDLVDECKTFYFAAQETTTGMLTWVMLLLAVHSNWQEEARKEVLDVFGNEDPDSDGIAKLRTMSMIMNEALRLYPPVIGFNRKVNQQLRLGKLVLPANIQVFIANLKLHQDPEIWGEDVHLFRPERFAEGVSKATNNNAVAFLPFGFGPRMCVGMNFTTHQGKIVLSMILQRYTFKLSPGYIHSPAQILTTRPLHGLQVVFHPL